MKKFRLTADEKEMIVRLLKSGLIGAEIAKRTGRSEATITKIRKEVERSGFDYWHNPGIVSRYI